MYETLFGIILWFIFIRTKRKVTSLKWMFFKWTLLSLLNVKFSAQISSAFVVFENNTLIDSRIDRTPLPDTNSVYDSNDTLNFVSAANVPPNDTSEQPELPMAQFFRHSLFVSAIYIVAYSVVFIIGLVGNCVVMIVVIRSSRMRNATNFL